MRKLVYLLCSIAACRGEGEIGKEGKGEGESESESEGEAEAEAESEAEGECVPKACEAVPGDAERLLLRGTLLTPDEVICNGAVSLSRKAGTIDCVGTDCEADGATVVCADLILPAFVDPHNHAQYNTAPPWPHAEKFDDRSEWQGDSAYHDWRQASDDLRDVYLCEAMKWAEARLLLGGTSAVQGTSGGDCIATLIRDLDGSEEAHGLGSDYQLETATFIDYLDSGERAEIRSGLESGDLDAFVPHAGEGLTTEAHDEIDELLADSLLWPGTAVIHAIAATTEDLAAFSGSVSQIIWSPRSNADLYGVTTPVLTARNLGIGIALGPDWTLSGSSSPLEELKCAAHINMEYYGNAFSERELVAMATSEAARAVGAEGQLGVLAIGARADVLALSGVDVSDPYASVIQARPEDVRLMLVNGVALYGDADAMTGIEPNEWCEDVDVCGATKRICVQTSEDTADKFDQTLSQLESTLTDALAEACAANVDCVPEAYTLFPLFSCEPFDSTVCNLGRSGIPGKAVSDDADGDGVVDTLDSCIGVFDPYGGDIDGDEYGDACDVCPLVADTTECPTPDPNDLDSDGLENVVDNCPTAENMGQEDSDADGRGDACDVCADGLPDGSTRSICQLRSSGDPGHPEIGEVVTIENAVVTAVHCGGEGFWVQAPETTGYGGIFVYSGDAGVTVTLGQVVCVTGEYDEYYDLSEIKVSSPADQVVVIDNTDPPEPIVVSPGDIATGGALAEALESMLVRVEDVEVIDENSDDSDYDEFTVTGGLRIDDYACVDPLDNTYPVGTAFSSIVGIAYYSFSNAKLLPRGLEDLTAAK